VAFGVLSLRDYYADMPANELADREDFIIYASELMRNRLVGAEIAKAMDWNVDEVRERVLNSPVGQMFRSMLFQRVVPNLKKLGLLTPKVRKAYTDLEIIQFEDSSCRCLRGRGRALRRTAGPGCQAAAPRNGGGFDRRPCRWRPRHLRMDQNY
jgi:hypothetical protein